MERIIFKGQILELVLNKFTEGMAASPGATAEVTETYYPKDEFVQVKWIRSNLLSAGQRDGGYYSTDFKTPEEQTETKSFIDIN